MNRRRRIVVAFVALAVFVMTPARAGESEQEPDSGVTSVASAGETSRPRLLELGSVTCVPCKMMEKVLESLRHDFGDQLDVDFVDVGEDPEAGKTHEISMIPTQIFFDPAGEELFRHEGFFAEEDIVAKWGELGYALEPRGGSSSASNGTSGLPDRLFASLTEAVEGSWTVALGAALVWGVLSILLSPCHLASIPLIIGFIDEQGRISTRRAFLISLLFASGILVTIGVIGWITAKSRDLMGDVGPWGAYIVAVVFFLVGLHLLEALPNPFSGPGTVGMKRKGPLAAFILGLVFGIALGPCTFAFMGPVLAVTFADHGYGALLLIAYGIGHCSVIVFAGTFTEAVQRYMNWNERSGGAVVLKKICGVLVVIGGLYMVFTAA